MKRSFRITALGLVLAATAQLQAARAVPQFTPNLCGDPCTTEGQETGCIDKSGPVWRRTICTCLNGHLAC
jgi:hypothetical protein